VSLVSERSRRLRNGIGIRNVTPRAISAHYLLKLKSRRHAEGIMFA
jgi:hypothetical protein